MYYTVANLTESFESKRQLLAEYIRDNKIDSVEKLNSAIAYVTENRMVDKLDMAEFDRASGVGVNVTEEDVKKTVKDFIESKKEELQVVRYTFNLTNYLAKLRSLLPFANGGLLNKE